MRKLLWVLLLSGICSAQTNPADDYIRQGNAAAHNDDHWGAIRSYEKAIEIDESLRDSLLYKLGQQYLWADRPANAARLLRQYVSKNPQECPAKSTLALALSWANQLKKAEDEYRDIATSCPDLKTDAMLGEARSLRWHDRFSDASELYRQVLLVGTDAQKNDAKLGLALIKLAQDQNRSARDDFRTLSSQPKPDPSVVEGLAVSDLHLGLPEQAQRDLQLGNASGVRSQQLDDLSEHIRTINSPQIAPAFQFFHDADGTNYYGGEARSSFALTTRSTVAAFFAQSNLSRDTISIDGRGGGLALDYRANESIAFHGEGRYTQYSGVNFHPVTGEFDAIVTPTDRSRLDLAVARITIWDTPTALQNHLAGTFGSIGLDQKITMQDTITAGFSATGWNDGNRRLLFRLTPSHRFEGVPRITLSLPMLYQTYDRGFSFGLFSPTSYTEITPALDIHFRRSRIWSFDLGGRLGGQKEAALEWKPIGAFHATIERDLKHGWGLKATVSHSSSNVASSTGFSRTSFFFTVARTF
ncbi:MAG TPA: tetratricopeptide repeat protein [Terriglobales bacterium]|nr:tetratricopeptide repeat protein [Terriglobales bacterium]